jgi:hypothetical protein
MEPGSIKYEIIQARDGNPVLLVESGGKMVPLHSKINPGREGEAYAERFDPDKYDVLIVLGTGLGYHLLPLAETINRYRSVVLLDIVPGIETKISGNPLTSFLTESENTLFLSGMSAGELAPRLGDLINLQEIRGLAVVEHAPSVRIFGEYYSQIKNEINRTLNRQAGSLSARKAFGRLYLANIIKNLRFMEKCRGVASIYNCNKAPLRDHPALVITSGPSLDSFLDEIKKYSDQFFIIAVDSALPLLASTGLIPDFAVSIDPQAYINEHFSGVEVKYTLPVFSLSVHHSLVKRYGGYLSLNTHPVSQLIEELFPGRVGSIDSRTGSVAGDAVMLALKAGFRDIGLAGFDFSFNGFNIYARGTAYQRRYAEFFQNRVVNVETSNFNYIMKSSRGYRRGGKYTRKSFIQYKESIEKFLGGYDTGIFHNINETGLPLEGVENREFSDFIKRACKGKINKQEILKEIRSGGPGTGVQRETLYSGFFDPEIFEKIYENSLDDLSRGERMSRIRLLAEKILL